MNAIDMFKIVVIVSLFFSFGINLISYTLPADARNYIGGYQSYETTYNPTDVNEKAQSAYNTVKTGIPLIDVAGSLVFFTGNIIIDLIMNFIFAIPSIITLIVTNIFGLMPIDATILAAIQIFMFAILCVMYIVNLISMLVNIFSRYGVGGVT